MRKIITLLMLAICSIGMYAQDEYDPKNPPDPQAPVKLYPLYCQISPAGAGYTDMGDGKKFEKGSAVTVNAESNSHYKFVCWMQDNDTISRNARLAFTMPEKEVRLVAVFSYAPDTPKDPDAPVIDPGKENPDPTIPEQKPDYDPTVPGNPNANLRCTDRNCHNR